jgi:signal peptidase I
MEDKERDLINKPRNVLISCVLTFLSIGMGHLYAGSAKKGIVLFVGQNFIFFSGFLLISKFPSIISLSILVFSGLVYLIYCLIDVIQITKYRATKYELKKYNRWYIYLTLLIFVFYIPQPITGDLIKKNIIQAFKIPAGSLKPTLLVGDQILAKTDNDSKTNLKRGDLIVFPYPVDRSKNFIKRIIAISGDIIKIKNKKVLLNGEILNEPYIVHASPKIYKEQFNPRDNLKQIKVPENSLFVMGDNRDKSHDSRFWGFVETSDVIGKASIIYWSWDKENSKVRWSRIGNIIK